MKMKMFKSSESYHKVKDTVGNSNVKVLYSMDMQILYLRYTNQDFPKTMKVEKVKSIDS